MSLFNFCNKEKGKHSLGIVFNRNIKQMSPKKIRKKETRKQKYKKPTVTDVQNVTFEMRPSHKNLLLAKPTKFIKNSGIVKN